MDTLTAENLHDLKTCIEGLKKDFLRVEPSGRAGLRFHFRNGLGDAQPLRQRYDTIFEDTLGKNVNGEGSCIITEAEAGSREWHFTVHSSYLIQLKNGDDPTFKESAASLLKVLDDLYRQYQMRD